MLIAFSKFHAIRRRKQAFPIGICLFLSYLCIDIVICFRYYAYFHTMRKTDYRYCSARNSSA